MSAQWRRLCSRAALRGHFCATDSDMSNTATNRMDRMPVSRRDLIGGIGALALADVVGSGLARAQPAPESPAAEITPVERAAMAEVATTFLSDQGVPGLSVVIANCGRVAYEAGFGFADKAKGLKVVPTSIFRIASVSKPFTSVAVFTLIEQGRLRLDSKVFGAGGVLGTDYGTPPYKAFLEDVTIEHLLTHTGGWQKDVHDPMFSHPGMNHAQLISWTIDNTPPTTAPGEAHFMSNFGFCLLGRVIEKITRQSYADYVRTAVLEPCGITDMRLAGNRRSERVRGEVVYYAEGGADAYRQDVARTDSNGGWIATAGDLVRFATHIDSILKPDTIATMTTPSSVNPHYAKGWEISNGGNWRHNGTITGTSAIMVRTKSCFAWAALANSRHNAPNQFKVVAALDRMVWDMVREVKGWKV
jgi:CubicO group peptidase (beta-lactamase class C family)